MSPPGEGEGEGEDAVQVKVWGRVRARARARVRARLSVGGRVRVWGLGVRLACSILCLRFLTACSGSMLGFKLGSGSGSDLGLGRAF